MILYAASAHAVGTSTDSLERGTMALSLHFPLGVSRLNADYADNWRQFARLDSLYRLVNAGGAFKSLSVRGYCDFRAVAPFNDELARARAVNASNFLRQHIGIHAAQTSVRGMGEDWGTLRDAIRQRRVAHADTLARIIDTCYDPDQRLHRMLPYDAADGTGFSALYPQMRRVDIRVGYTHVPGDVAGDVAPSPRAGHVAPSPRAQTILGLAEGGKAPARGEGATSPGKAPAREQSEATVRLSDASPAPRDTIFLRDTILVRDTIVPRQVECREPWLLASTNALYLATTTLNVGIEYRFSPLWSAVLAVAWNPWDFADGCPGTSCRCNPKLHHWLVVAEGRRWLGVRASARTLGAWASAQAQANVAQAPICDGNRGFYIGAEVFGGKYNIGGIHFISCLDKRRYRGSIIGGGITAGYRHRLSHSWAMEESLGLGYAHLSYDKYVAGRCGQLLAHENKNWVGPVRAAVSFIFVIR